MTGRFAPRDAASSDGSIATPRGGVRRRTVGRAEAAVGCAGLLAATPIGSIAATRSAIATITGRRLDSLRPGYFMPALPLLRFGEPTTPGGHGGAPRHG